MYVFAFERHHDRAALRRYPPASCHQPVGQVGYHSAPTLFDALRNPVPEFRVGATEVGDAARNDPFAHRAGRDLRQATGDVVDQALLGLGRQESVEIPSLVELVGLTVIPVIRTRTGPSKLLGS
jgi:hypothetical protein